MKKTVISHFYNEEYLLPWWLDHHRKIFDHGIMIDYSSTDRSREIIKKMCPNWEIIDSRNQWFCVYGVDNEINDVQSALSGWRMALTVTEFLVGDLCKIFSVNTIDQKIKIPISYFFDWNPDGRLNRDIPLWEQLSIAYDPQYVMGNRDMSARLLHNCYDHYPPGRHYLLDNTVPLAGVFKYSDCISSPDMFARRVQNQHRIPIEQKTTWAGWQHHNFGKGITLEFLKAMNLKYQQGSQDLSQGIKRLTQYKMYSAE